MIRPMTREVINLDKILFNHFEKDLFFNTVWERQTAKIKFKTEDLGWNNDIYFDWLNHGYLDAKSIQLVKKNTFLTMDKFLERNPQIRNKNPGQSENLDSPLISEYINNKGYSIKSFSHDQYLLPCRKIALEFSQYFDSNISFNSYYTPKNSQCYKRHRDKYNIFILQVKGEKTWKVQNPSDYQEDMINGDFEDVVQEENPDDQVIDLKEGEILYLPAAMAHSATTPRDKDSLHFTIGIHPRTVKDELIKLSRSEKFSGLKNKDPFRGNLKLQNGEFKSDLSKEDIFKLIIHFKDILNKQ